MWVYILRIMIAHLNSMINLNWPNPQKHVQRRMFHDLYQIGYENRHIYRLFQWPFLGHLMMRMQKFLQSLWQNISFSHVRHEAILYAVTHIFAKYAIYVTNLFVWMEDVNFTLFFSCDSIPDLAAIS